MEIDGGEGAQPGRGGAGRARSWLGDERGRRARTVGLDSERRTGVTASSGREESVRERERELGEGERESSGFYRERGGEGETPGWGGERPAMAINAIE
jgi:hypothetical protein